MNIIDSNSLLSQAQKDLLVSNAQVNFVLENFSSLDDIVSQLGVDIIIEPGQPTRNITPDYFDEIYRYWRDEYERLREMARENETLWQECQRVEMKLWQVNRDRRVISTMRLLGLYNPQTNNISLFPEAMANCDSTKMNELLVSTMAHEVMHAYFNRPRHNLFPYVMSVEEPLAEFGMLLYMHDTNNPYYDWAFNNVRGKNCCYGYGANLMDQYLNGDQSLHNYLEEFKITLQKYDMLDDNRGVVSLPKNGQTVSVNGNNINVVWKDIIKLPKYFWDENSATLGLDGDWSAKMEHRMMYRYHDMIHHDLIHTEHDAKNLYLGADFYIDDIGDIIFSLDRIFATANIILSPNNRYYVFDQGVLQERYSGRPILQSCGNGLYKIFRNGKWGVVDSDLNQVVPCNYDFVWSFDDNGLCKVGKDHLKGYVNMKGKEQIPVIYEDVNGFENGCTAAKKDRKYGVIDENNNTIHPFNMDYSDCRIFRNGYAPCKRNDKWGAIAYSGNEVIPCMYDSLFYFDKNHIAEVKKDGQEFKIDTHNNILK